MFVFSQAQYRDFYKRQPAATRAELDRLDALGLADSPRALQIYGAYSGRDLLFGQKWALLAGLAVCVPLGLGVGFWVSRRITRPLASMAEVAKRVQQGDLSARALKGQAHGEMAEMIDTFNRMADALEHLERERQATAASISHELRTPLAVLQARLHAICDGVIDASAAEHRMLLAQVEHLGRLVGDLHTLSMADAGQLSLQMQELDVAALARQMLEQFQPRLREAGMELSLALPPRDGAARIRADGDRMRQIVSNLLTNAMRHGGSGHWLGVSVETESDAQGRPWVALRVSDAGPGLPGPLQSRPFQRFAQAPGQRGREGSGLGLSIVKALAVAQGGEVSADNSERGGARVSLRFPKI
jgi:signal transduction histidine kinase